MDKELSVHSDIASFSPVKSCKYFGETAVLRFATVQYSAMKMVAVGGQAVGDGQGK